MTERPAGWIPPDYIPGHTPVPVSPGSTISTEPERTPERKKWVGNVAFPPKFMERQNGLTVSFVAGEEMRTEISAKFRPDGLTGELTVAGLRLLELWADPGGDFALSLSTPK